MDQKTLITFLDIRQRCSAYDESVRKLLLGQAGLDTRLANQKSQLNIEIFLSRHEIKGSPKANITNFDYLRQYHKHLESAKARRDEAFRNNMLKRER